MSRNSINFRYFETTYAPLNIRCFVCAVSEADSLLESPFTQPLSASMMVLKEKQSREKAHPPGTSKILARARRKAMEEEDKKVIIC